MPSLLHDSLIQLIRDHVIVEAQLARDPDKLFTWPTYAICARARYRCPFMVVVVTPRRAVARWAAQTIDLGYGGTFPIDVVGPDGIPAITDPWLAREDPHLAVLSALAHGRGEPRRAAATIEAAVRAIARRPKDKRVLYPAAMESALGAAVRQAFEKTDIHKFLARSPT